MVPAAEMIARIMADESNKQRPNHCKAWQEMTAEDRRTQLAAAHRVAEVFGLFGEDVHVAGDTVTRRRTIRRPDRVHPVLQNMVQAERETAWGES